MKCMYCGCFDSKVIDSRAADDGTIIRRRRECINCGKRFTTYETVENTPIFVVRQVTGKRQTTLSRIDLENIKKIEKQDKKEQSAHKTSADFRKYVYAPTLFPETVYRITVIGRYEKAEIIIECSDEYADYLRSAVVEASNIKEE